MRRPPRAVAAARAVRGAGVLGAAAVALVTACRPPAPAAVPGGEPEASPPTVAVAPVDAALLGLAPPPPTLRLPAGVAAVRYRAHLTVDPARPEFEGALELDASLAQPTSLVWLNADRLDVEGAEAVVAGAARPLVVEAHPPGFLGLRAAAPLPAGEVTLRLRYRGALASRDALGAFVQPVAGEPYVFTQLQPLGARRVFPCLDEPASKVPWTLTLTVPAAAVALANAPAVADEVDGAWRTVRFAETPPLPAYLLAFAVGPFELVDAGATRGGAPIRIVAPRGRGADAAWAAEVTGRLVTLLEDWFASPYPFAKLDSLAIPATVDFEAMENPGLITYREDLLLMDPRRAGEDDRRSYALVAAHELAHQWFGNLVTPAWWDELWLAEAFATWMEEKVMAAFSPAWATRNTAAAARARALAADGRLTTRRLRQPIAHADDIETAFDAITYDKGAAVLRLLEAWVEPAALQAGVRAYLARHAGATATSEDFLAAVDAASPQDVTSVIRTFLDQPGAPRIEASLRCERRRPPVLTLTQQRWLPRDVAEPGEPARWQAPVCVAYGTRKTRQTTCTVLADATTALTLEGRCPDWVFPDAGARGYHRVALAPALLDALLADGWGQLQPHERIALAADVRAAVERGELPVAVELGLARKLARDGSRHALELAVGIARDALELVGPDAAPRVRRWALDTLASRARTLGFLRDRGDNAERELARAAVVPLVAELGEAKLAARALELARRWRELEGEARPMVLRSAVRQRPEVLEEVLEALPTADDPRAREELLEALAALDEPAAVARALEVLRDPRVDLKEGHALLLALAERRATQPLAEAFLRDHVDELLPRLPEQVAASLARVITASCDPARRADAEAWLRAHLAALPGATRVIPQELEAMERCVARRALLGPALDAHFAAGE